MATSDKDIPLDSSNSNNDSNLEEDNTVIIKNFDIENSHMQSIISNKNVVLNSNIESEIKHELNKESINNQTGESDINVTVDNDDFNIFNDEKIYTIEEKEYIQESNREYRNDVIYEAELNDQLLSAYPITRQDSKYIQEQVSKEVDIIIELKNIGKIKCNNIQNGLKSIFLKRYYNDIFLKNWIIPISSDIHKIFRKVSDTMDSNSNKSTNQNTECYIHESIEKNGVDVVDQKKELIKYYEYHFDYAQSSGIDFVKFMKKTFKLFKPYLYNNKIDEKEVGYTINLKDDSKLLRYYNYDNIYWKFRVGLGPFYVTHDVDQEHSDIIRTIRKPLIEGEKTNIVGFYIPPLAGNGMKNNFGRTKHIGKLMKVGNITNITATNPVVITIKNHNLLNEQKIFIKQTNSFPNINGIYQKSVKVLTKDTFSINYDLLGGEKGNSGIVYSTKKLYYNKYIVGKDFTIKPDGEIKDEDNNPKIILFDKLLIKDKDSKKKLLEKIIPSVDDIISKEYNLILKCNTLDDIDKILERYKITHKDLDISQFNLIKNELSKKITEINSNVKNIIIPKKKEVSDKFKESIKDSNYIFSNDNINSNITEYYGKYTLNNSADDCTESRYSWIIATNDFGELFIKKMLLNKINRLNRNDYMNYIKLKKNEYEEDLKSVQTNYENEKKLRSYFKKEEDCQKYTTINVENDENQLKTLEESGNNHEDGRKALVKENNGNFKLYEWKNKKWNELKDIPKYKSLKYLCEFKNIDITNININQIDCLYKRAMGCHSRKYMRFTKKLNFLKNIHENFTNLYDSIQGNKDKKIIKAKIDNIIHNNYNIIKKVKKKEIVIKKPEKKNTKDTVNNSNVNISLPLHNLLNIIKGINNKSEKNYLIDKIIDKDGLLIGLDVYSKKYKKKLYCGHWAYLKKIRYSNNDIIKKDLFDDMISKYGDDGKANHSIITCINCGSELSRKDHDPTEGFNKFGSIIKSREIWDDKITDTLFYEENINNFKVKDTYFNMDCNSKDFIGELLERGLKPNNIDKSVKICSLIINIITKAGINFKKNEIIDIIIDCYKNINNISTSTSYKKREIEKLHKEGRSNKQIDDLDTKGYFKKSFNRYKLIKYYSLVATRILIAVQTAIPTYSRASDNAICPFFGFDGKYGIEYMVCIIDKLGVIDIKKKEKRLEFIKLHIENTYYKFIKFPYIKKLYQQKTDHSKLDEKVIYKNKIMDSVRIKKQEKLIDDYDIKVKKIDNFERIKQEKNKLLTRTRYVSQEIMDKISTVISSSSTNEPPSLPENSCCTEKIDEYINYYNFINEYSNKTVYDLIKESILLEKYKHNFINAGVYTKITYSVNSSINTYNNIVISTNNEITQSIIKEKFLLYCDTVPNIGSRRKYILDDNNNENSIDILSGKTRKEILSKTYEIGDYKKLLDTIANKNYKKITNEINDKNKDIIIALSKESDTLETEIKNFINRLAYMLNKETDNNFKKKYTRFLNKIGKYDNIYKIDENASNIKKIKETNLFRNYRVHILKKIINNYFRKYISIIANQCNKSKVPAISFITSEDLAKDMQQYIVMENERIAKYITPENSLLFKNLKFEYSYDFINDIYGKTDIYNCKYSKIIKESRFNIINAGDLLLYILLKQLTKFLIKSGKEYEFHNVDDKEFDILNKNGNNNILANFIISIFNIIENNEESLNISEENMTKFTNKLREDKIVRSIAVVEKLDGLAKQFHFSKTAKGFSNEKDNYEKLLDTEDYMDGLKTKAKDELTKTLGSTPTENQIDDYTEEYIRDERVALDIEESDFNFNQPKEGMDVLDTGYDYGSLPQGIEDE